MVNLKIGLLSYGEWMKNAENELIIKEMRSRGLEVYHLNVEELSIRFAYQQGISSITAPNLDDLTKLDILMLRGVFKYMKLSIVISQFAQLNGVTVIDNGLAQEKYLINKINDGFKLIQAGLPYPKSAYALSVAQYQKQGILAEFSYPLIVKHRSMGKGCGIYKVNDRVDAENLLEELEEKSDLQKYYLQEFLNIKADYRIFVIGNQVLGSMQRFPRKGDFRANFSLGGTVKPAETTAEMQDLAIKAAQATNATTYAGVDVFYSTEDKPYLLEVNRTPGFTGFMKAHQIDVPKLIVDHVLAAKKGS